MSGLNDIPIIVSEEAGNPAWTGNVVPILNEVRHALSLLASSGETTLIDLTAIPFGPGEREDLMQILGKGEIDATLRALGESHIRETAYPGVWLITHLSPQGAELTTHIEVTRSPTLLSTPEQDVSDAAAALATYLCEQSAKESA